MKTAVVVLAAIVSFGSVNSESLIMGDNFCNHVVFIRNVQFMGIPFVKREKDIFFSSNFNEKISRIAAIEKYPIKAKATVTAGGLGQTYKIAAIEKSPTNAMAIVTAGGLGQTYVNVRLTSARGKGLYYTIIIHSCNTTQEHLKNYYRIHNQNLLKPIFSY